MWGQYEPYWVSGAKPQPPNAFLDIIGAYKVTWALDEGKSLLFFLSYAQKWRVRYPSPKIGGTHTPRTPVSYAYVSFVYLWCLTSYSLGLLWIQYIILNILPVLKNVKRWKWASLAPPLFWLIYALINMGLIPLLSNHSHLLCADHRTH